MHASFVIGYKDTRLFPNYNFILHYGISKLFGTTYHHDKTIWRMQEPLCLHKSKVILCKLCAQALVTHVRVLPTPLACLVEFQIKLFDTNNQYDMAICRVQEPCR